jgi:hypothetical protein
MANANARMLDPLDSCPGQEERERHLSRDRAVECCAPHDWALSACVRTPGSPGIAHTSCRAHSGVVLALSAAHSASSCVDQQAGQAWWMHGPLLHAGPDGCSRVTWILALLWRVCVCLLQLCTCPVFPCGGLEYGAVSVVGCLQGAPGPYWLLLAQHQLQRACAPLRWLCVVGMAY